MGKRLKVIWGIPCLKSPSFFFRKEGFMKKDCLSFSQNVFGRKVLFLLLVFAGFLTSLSAKSYSQGSNEKINNIDFSSLSSQEDDLTFKADLFNASFDLSQSFAQNKRAPERRPPEKPPVEHYYSADSALFELFANIFFLGWFVSNGYVEFDTYPYANGKYLIFPGFTDEEEDASGETYYYYDENGQEQVVATSESSYKAYRFELQAGAFNFFVYDSNSGALSNLYGTEVRFEGFIWKFFGPVFEYSVYSSKPLGSEEIAIDFTNLRLGGQISIIHSNWFDWSFFIQWEHWSNPYSDTYTVQNGYSVGSIIRCYPVKPLMIEWRNAFHSLDENTYDQEDLWTSVLEVGFMLNSRWELYGDWKYFIYEYQGLEGNAFSGGVKIHW